MERVRNSIGNIGEQPKPFVSMVQEEVESFFDSLPFFQPRVWKFFAAVGIAGFIVGFAFATWAKYTIYTLTK